jgi:tetratricopeptide (TPR) repeat protein
MGQSHPMSPTLLRRLFLALLAALLLAAPAVHASFDDALALYREKRYPEARTAFSRLAAAEPQDGRHRFYLGAIAMRRNDTDDAIHQFEQAVALDPKNAGYHLELGGAYGAAAGKASLMSKMGWARKCRASLERAVELDPDNLDARNGLITFYRQAPGIVGGGIGKAYTQAEEIRKRDFFRGSLILGQLYASERRFDEAFAVARELQAASPDAYLAHYTVGRLAAESGQHLDEGEKCLQRCLELTPARDEPHHAAAHWRLGNIAEKRRNPDAARAAYEAALKLDPNFKPAAESLTKLRG